MTDPVQDTISRIQDRLSTSWNDWAVTRDDVEAIAADLEGLLPAQRQEVIAGLSDSDLQTLADEIMQTGPIIGGLGASARAELFSDLAQGLDGVQLGRLATAFATTEGNSQGFTPIAELASAVAANAGTQQKLDFIAQLAPRTTDTSSFYNISFGTTQTTGADAEANAVGTVLASLRGQGVTEALSSLDDRQLQAVIDSAIQTRTFSSGQGAMTLDWNTEGYEDIMAAVATARSVGGNAPIDSVEQRARVFDAAGTALAEVDGTSSVIGGLVVLGKADTLSAVSGGMAEVLQSDTTGITAELTYDARFDEGGAMTAFAKALLNSGGEEQLGEIMLQLQLGNDGSEDPVTRLESQLVLGPDRTINANAGALGYFVGSVYAATRQISTDIADQQAMVTGVLQSVLTVIDKSGVGGRLTALSASLARVWVADAVEAAISDPGAGPAQRLEDSALPVDASNNRSISDAANSAFDDSISKVLRNN